jgi:hypothetical protein
MAGELLRSLKGKHWSLSMILAMLSVFTLPAAWYWWSLERLSALDLQQTRQRESVTAPLASQVGSRLSSWKAAQANVASFQEKIKSMGETPAQWSHRSITIDNQRMSRVEAEQYLRDLTNDDRNLLAPTTISIRAAKAGESVIVEHKGLDKSDALVVTIKADLYTRGAP